MRGIINLYNTVLSITQYKGFYKFFYCKMKIFSWYFQNINEKMIYNKSNHDSKTVKRKRDIFDIF